MITLSLISFISTILVVAYMIISGNYKAENCWDKYSTEQEAIINCEGEQ
jgi:hypothetical protein